MLKCRFAFVTSRTMLFTMENNTKRGAFLMMWILLSVVTMCTAQCAFSEHASDATKINVAKCGLTSITTAELTRFTRLEGLVLSGNSLTAFPDLTPVGNTLKSINLNGNRISINKDMLQSLTALTSLLLNRNKLTTFPDLSPLGSTLKKLQVNHNQISDINSDLLISLIKLRHLNLSFNSLTTFPDLSPVGSTLMILDLEDIHISEITGDVLLSLTALEQLFLSGNTMVTFPDLSHIGSSLKVLTLGYNQISDIRNDMLLPLNKLEQLSLPSIGLSTFPDLSPIGSILRDLNLQDNHINHISNEMLLHLKTLTVLYLSRNMLTKFPDLTPLRSTLQTLYLDDNLISEINDETLWNLTNLDILDLSNNMNLTHFPGIGVYGENFKQLNISGTSISYLTPLLHENIVNLDLCIQRSVNVCKCANAWLKQIGPKMANFEYDDNTCDGHLWSRMTVDDMNMKCDRKKHKPSKYFKVVKTQVALKPSMLHTYEAGKTKLKCTMKCLDTPGCVSFYWHTLQDRLGDCVLIAPGNSIREESVPNASQNIWS